MNQRLGCSDSFQIFNNDRDQLSLPPPLNKSFDEPVVV